MGWNYGSSHLREQIQVRIDEHRANILEGGAKAFRYKGTNYDAQSRSNELARELADDEELQALKRQFLYGGDEAGNFDNDPEYLAWLDEQEQAQRSKELDDSDSRFTDEEVERLMSERAEEDEEV